MKDFRILKVWERSHELILDVYKATRKLPKEERFALTDQIRRSGTSIETNIAEGCGRESDGDFKHFLIIAMGSSSELEYQLQLAYDLGYLEKIHYGCLAGELVEIRKMLNSLIQRIKSDGKMVIN